MVKVKDTAWFIERARSFHGDWFDYTKSDYKTNKTPVTFQCTRCKREITCRPCDHLRIQKAIKCRCHQTKTKEAKAKRHQARKLRQERRHKLRSRPCKICGKPVDSIDKRKTCCSRACGFIAMQKPKVVVACVICSKEIVKLESRLGASNAHCCSMECQQKWRSKLRPRKERDWVAASRKAKAVYKKRQQQQRKRYSEQYRFWKICLLSLKNSEPERWARRCNSAAHQLAERFSAQKKKKKSRPATWKSVVINESRKVRQTSCRYKRSEWEWKCTAVAQTLAKRMKRKELQKDKKNILLRINRQVQQPKQLSFWE